VVVPPSTITNWQREFHQWAPSVDVLLYHGLKEERQAMREKYGFEKPKKKKSGEAIPVILTSFEVAMNDGKKLQNLDWKYLIVDEGHRLKNKDCRLLRELKALKADNRLLLSGTPLQNNLTELWSLLHFILPDIFQDLQTFQTWFDFDEQLHSEDGTQRIIEEEGKNKTISKLHTILDPFLLRRLKTDVLKFLPPKREYVILAPMTQKQMKFNNAIRDRTLESEIKEANTEFEMGEQGWEKCTTVNKSATSLQNIMMQMRKNCNHPYLFQRCCEARTHARTLAHSLARARTHTYTKAPTRRTRKASCFISMARSRALHS
jgi:ATP-dependent DNA helicase